MKKLSIILILTCLFLSTGYGQDTLDFTKGRVKFIDYKNLPIVKGTINGKIAYFIVDTGATISVLDLNQASEFGYRSHPFKNNYNVESLGDKNDFNTVVDFKVFVGGIDFRGDYFTKDISRLVTAINENNKVIITGIIGSNILKKNGIIIDYHTMSLYMAKHVELKHKNDEK